VCSKEAGGLYKNPCVPYRGACCNTPTCLLKFIDAFYLDPKATITEAGKRTLIAAKSWQPLYETSARLATIAAKQRAFEKRKDDNGACFG